MVVGKHRTDDALVPHTPMDIASPAGITKRKRIPKKVTMNAQNQKDIDSMSKKKPKTEED
jgi:hypothetical protein